jgi:hypothetical protein
LENTDADVLILNLFNVVFQLPDSRGVEYESVAKEELAGECKEAILLISRIQHTKVKNHPLSAHDCLLKWILSQLPFIWG